MYKTEYTNFSFCIDKMWVSLGQFGVSLLSLKVAYAIRLQQGSGWMIKKSTKGWEKRAEDWEPTSESDWCTAF